MTLQDLVQRHEYAKALVESRRRLMRDPGDLAALAWHARVLLCLERLSEALEEYRRVDEYERSERAGTSGRALMIGAIQWLLGQRGEALRTFESAVEGVQSGSIEYTDFAGGVTQGLLLWYAGVTSDNASAKKRALEYLRERAGGPLIDLWPGPLARLVLGAASQDEVLMQACGKGDLRRAMRSRRGDVLKRRRLVNALFCVAVARRAEGLEQECLLRMRDCVTVENPIVEVEWYLARGECESAEREKL